MSYNILKLEISGILQEKPKYEGKLPDWLNYHDGRWELVNARPDMKFAPHAARKIGLGNLVIAFNRILEYMNQDSDIIGKIRQISQERDGSVKKIIDTKEAAGLLLVQLLEDLSVDREIRELPALQRQRIKLVVDNTQKGTNDNGYEERERKANAAIGIGHQN